MPSQSEESASTRRVTIDRPECISCASCWTDCPEFFEQNADDQQSEVVPAYRENGELGAGKAPPHLVNCVQLAEADCPVAIIHVES